MLFVCEHNAGRSRLAAGLAAAYAGDRVKVLSAGTSPDAAVSSVMLASLAELSIDRSDQEPTQVSDDLLDLPNPATWDLDSIRPLRHYLQQRVRALIDQVITDHDADKPAADRPSPSQSPTGEASSTDSAFNVSGTTR